MAVPLLIAACSASPGDPRRVNGVAATATTTASAPATAAAASPSGAPSAAARYAFPVRSARAKFSRAHHDYPAADIFAPCGTPVVAPASGRVTEVTTTDTWTSARDDGETRGGLSVTILGDDGTRYYGSHLSRLTPAATPGRPVVAGEPLGAVGRTGSARGTPCHLHFGLSPVCSAGDWWVRRGVVSPYDVLRAWQRGQQRSPALAVAAWKAKNRCPSPPPP